MNSFLACLFLLDAGDENRCSFVGFLKEGRKTFFGNDSRFRQLFEPILELYIYQILRFLPFIPQPYQWFNTSTHRIHD